MRGAKLVGVAAGVLSLGALGVGVAMALGRDEETPPLPGPLPPLPGGGGPQSSDSAPWPTGWAARQARIRQIADRIEAATGWQGLSDYLAAVAYTESRGNPNAAAGTSANSARGLTQLRPKTGLAHDLKAYQSRPSLLFDPNLNLALAAWLAYRLRNFRYKGQTVDMLAVRRGWALPRLVADVNETAEVDGYAPGERSRDVRTRFAQALPKAGLPQSFMQRPAYTGLKWPGIWRVMDAAGVDYQRLGITRPGAMS